MLHAVISAWLLFSAKTRPAALQLLPRPLPVAEP
jgi:hypothetical protein